MLFSLVVSLVPIAVILTILFYGPVRNRWWRRETPLGFAVFVGTITFMLGFVGPMLFAPGANQGPLLGVLYTGPIGLGVGLVWGFFRAARRSTR